MPLVVAGPGVPHGTTSHAMIENIDLAETFAAIGGTTLNGDGHSLLGLLHGAPATGWRNAILVEALRACHGATCETAGHVVIRGTGAFVTRRTQKRNRI